MHYARICKDAKIVVLVALVSTATYPEHPFCHHELLGNQINYISTSSNHMTTEDKVSAPNKCTITKDTINKTVLLNWLYLSSEEVSIAEIGKLIEARTKGKYALISRDELNQHDK